jgi:hypothetical protein
MALPPVCPVVYDLAILRGLLPGRQGWGVLDRIRFFGGTQRNYWAESAVSGTSGPGKFK